jgi:hypothetical protein
MTFRLLAVARRLDSSILVSMPIIVLGLIIVTFAVLKAPWPPDPRQYGRTVSHFERLRGDQAESAASENDSEDADWYWRRVIDGAVLLALVLGYAGTCALIGLNQPRVLPGLMANGLVGVICGAWGGLELGPMLTAGGFSLTLFGAGLGWASRYAANCQVEKTRTQTGTGFGNHETHSAA